MGDIADWCNDQMQDAYPDWCPVGAPRYQGNDVTCKHCGAENLDWIHTGVRWRLLNSDGKLHVCNTAASANEFEDIS